MESFWNGGIYITRLKCERIFSGNFLLDKSARYISLSLDKFHKSLLITIIDIPRAISKKRKNDRERP